MSYNDDTVQYIGELSQMYEKHLAQISDKQRFSKALEIYGNEVIYEAIFQSATRKLEGDPLSYVIAVAHSLWKERRELEEQKVRYEMRILQAKERTLEHNEILATKIDKAKKVNK